MRSRLGDAFAQLSAERDRLDRLLEQLQEGVLAVDRELQVQFANANARLMLDGARSRRARRCRRRTAGCRCAGSPKGSSSRRAGRRGAQPAGGRRDALARRRARVPSELAVLVLADITEQERRRQAEREFVANASHELRTPVAAIASAVEALKSGAADSPESRKRFIDLIGRQSTRLTRLSSSLLILARAQTQQETVQLEPVELRGLLQEIAAASDPADGVACASSASSPSSRSGSVTSSSRSSSNLVGNALKHTVTGEVVLRAEQNGRKATIEICDTGPGITPAVQARIFDRFYSVDVNGGAASASASRSRASRPRRSAARSRSSPRPAAARRRASCSRR